MDPNLLFRAILASPFSRFRASISRLAFSATSTRSYHTCLFWLVSAILFAIAYHLSGCFVHDSGSSTIYVYKFIYFYKSISLGSNYSTDSISWANLSSNFWDFFWDSSGIRVVSSISYSSSHSVMISPISIYAITSRRS